MATDGLATIIASTDRLEINSRGAIAGRLWIGEPESGAAFPEQDWSDSSVALLSSWIPALQHLAKHGVAAECYFIDGPYHFGATAVDSERWVVTCFEDRDAAVRIGRAVLELRTTPAVFLGSALAVARTVLGHCDSRGWWNDDTERLRTAVEVGLPQSVS